MAHIPPHNEGPRFDRVAQDTGGWLSGPMEPAPLGSEIEAGIRRAESGDFRPEFSPAALVFEVQDVLKRCGVQVSPDTNLNVAIIAAADLLRAMGVRPVTAPRR